MYKKRGKKRTSCPCACSLWRTCLNPFWLGWPIPYSGYDPLAWRKLGAPQLSVVFRTSAFLYTSRTKKNSPCERRFVRFELGFIPTFTNAENKNVNRLWMANVKSKNGKGGSWTLSGQVQYLSNVVIDLLGIVSTSGFFFELISII